MKVVPINGNGDKKTIGHGDGGDNGREDWCRWQALQVVAMLPQSSAEALMVLTWAVTIVRVVAELPKPTLPS